MPTQATGSELQVALNWVQERQEMIKTRDPGLTFYRGKHRTVLSTPDLPGRVLKIEPFDQERVSSMLAASERCRHLIEERGFARCCVPQMAYIRYGEEKGIWVEERIEGFYDPSLAQDHAEEEFTAAEPGSALHAKWLQIFEQTAEIIAETGYWDVNWKNLVLMQEGVGFVDFEDINGSRKQAALGLSNLLDFAPPFAFDSIASVIEKHGLQDEFASTWVSEIKESYSERMARLKHKREEELLLHGRIRAVHRSRGTTIHDPLPIPSSYGPETWVHKEFTRFNEERSSPYIQGLVEGRCIRYQPLAFRGRGETKESFEATLEELKREGIVIEWCPPPDSDPSYYHKIYV